ncbi:hypothetical protein AGRA3207_002503 [Actinomadura graeca]|uniref:Polymerase nucleotidyl transferase domain-containing protein n=1 Tax=Actinomadura graeca TaxID=2750812 RepID=A0ABX8QSE2_9ACTN|nr:hypothetical protein [Actinomadura graeca]QXJ21630.1 hypothetical protein AGRA3207_002503 [Actinomadura graeca]
MDICVDVGPDLCGRLWRRPPPHEDLPSCSMVLTRGGLLAAKVASVDGSSYGLVGYVVDAGDATAKAARVAFSGRDWLRTLNMSYDAYAPLVAARQPGALVPALGRIARIDPATLVATVSTRDPALLAEHSTALDELAASAGICSAKIGVYGSAAYKDRAAQGDLDVVIYGWAASRRVHARAAGATPPRHLDHPHTPHFRLPGSQVTFDPRYLVGEHAITAALVRGEYTAQAPEPLTGLWVLDARAGVFFPARYTLSDGSVLLSYRAGHSGWLRPGDELAGPPLPVYRRRGVRYRMVLRCETLDARRAHTEQDICRP